MVHNPTVSGKERGVSQVHRLGELARLVEGRIHGDAQREIEGLATLEDAGPRHLSFFTNPRYRAAACATRAGAVLVGPGSGLTDRDLLEVQEPYLAFAQLLALYHPPAARSAGVSPDARVAPGVRLGRDVRIEAFAVLDEGVVLGDRVVIGAGSVLGRDVEVGSETELRPRVVLYPETRVGSRCLIHAGAVLGADGFGFATREGRHHKVPQVGRVVVEDEVEIGANTTIDRATLGETRIGRGSKIDDLVMVAHGVRLGESSLLAAQAGIAGSTRTGGRLTLAGQSGVAGHLELGERVTVAAKSAVLQDLPDGAVVAGAPAFELGRWKRTQALVQRLSEWRAEIRELRRRVAALEVRRPTED
jgi:UDP-3-O-[3-hydroxymyristoyl] glucosamine N-acyltransferase